MSMSNDPQHDRCADPRCDHARRDHSRISGCLVEDGPRYCACAEFVESTQSLFGFPTPLDGPETPYAGTSGWSGSDTSRDRAETEDADGTTHARQQRVVTYLRLRGATGATWKALADEYGWHHGQASGALSVLHKTGHIARLTERRDRCAVYVLPEFVQGRETADHGRKRPKPSENPEVRRVVGEAIGAGSTCWEHLDRAGVFQSDRASKIVDDLLADLDRLA